MMGRSLLLVLIALMAGAAGPWMVAGESANASPRVAIIVGPVGEALTPSYLGLAERAASAAEAAGATVARAYSPHASPAAAPWLPTKARVPTQVIWAVVPPSGRR